MPFVEFYGIPRERAGIAATTAAGKTLGEVLLDLSSRFPEFAADCVDSGGRLRPQVVANVGGESFVRHPGTHVAEDAVVLILSADAGG
jgi:molybdopterin converting factor small subunit